MRLPLPGIFCLICEFSTLVEFCRRLEIWAIFSPRFRIMVESGLNLRTEKRNLLVYKLTANRAKPIDEGNDSLKGMATIELSFVLGLFVWTTVCLSICLFCFLIELIFIELRRKILNLFFKRLKIDCLAHCEN